MEGGLKRQVISAIFGALLTGLVSLSVAYYNTNQQFEIVFVSERKASLEKQAQQVQLVRSELSRNLELLLDKEFITASMEVEDKHTKALDEVMSLKLPKKDPAAEKWLKKYLSFFASLGEQQKYEITENTQPKHKFYVQFKEILLDAGDVDYSVKNKLVELYASFSLVNEAIERMDRFYVGYMITEGQVSHWKNGKELFDENIRKISKDQLIGIMGKLSDEQKKIELMLQKL